VARALIALPLACCAAAALAQPVADPTRPPSFVEAGAATAAGSPAAPASPLQSVMLRAGAKPKALLSGEWVELGQEYNGARLVKVTEASVTLKGPSGDETLYLTPDVVKQPVKPAPSRQRGSQSGEKK
jgi:MSHA biogenesis protein MshK